MTGIVKRILLDKNFGFLRPDGERVEWFFHKSGSPDWHSLEEGSRVEFDEEASPKGPRAMNVRLA